ncbi:MAG: UDP-N-acetylmuramate dehydrogenase [Clostridia bacterium]|nr:UDP-N-acetylmuramate dehydrogenase [Clostridia bacterium]
MSAITTEAQQQLLQELKQQLPNLNITPNAVMAKYTTLHTGGPADLLAQPGDVEELRFLLVAAHAMQVPVTVIGHGSNLVVRDGGIRGLVIRIGREMRHVSIKDDLVTATAGTMLTVLAHEAASASLGGLVFASGIPGTVGGGVYMNAGAYGGDMSQVVIRVDGFDLAGLPFSYSRRECEFDYRHSRFQHEDKIISRVYFQLPGGDREELMAQMVELNKRRAEKQPLTMPSAGSTFKRPEGHFAAALIDECGLKGYTIGGASVSEKHAGFCVNNGGTAKDFLDLIAHVQKVVYEEKGVRLEPEVRILGED